MSIKIVRTKAKPKEFSKKVITAMTLLWFVAALFGGVVVWVNDYGLEALLSYVGAPMTGGIIGYMIKSAMENKEKIKKDQPEQVKGENHP